MIAVTDGGNKRCTDVVQSSGFSDATIQSDTLSDFDNAGTTVSKYHAVPVITVTSAGLKLIRRLSFRLSVTVLGHVGPCSQQTLGLCMCPEVLYIDGKHHRPGSQ